MEYNKRRFQKANDKKVLHKVRKHWVVMSMALLMAIGGGAAVTHASANADTTANNNGDQNNGSTNTIKERLNQSLVQGQKQAQSNNNQSAQQANRAQLNNQTSAQANSRSISQQANVLHNQIMNNAVANGATQGRTIHNNVGATNNSESTQNSANNNVSAQAPKNNVKAPKVNSVGNNNVNKVASDVKVNQANVKSDVKNQNNQNKYTLGSTRKLGSVAPASGTWGTAKWTLNNGNLFIHDGTITSGNYITAWSNVVSDTTGDIDRNKVVNVTFKNVKTSNNFNHFPLMNDSSIKNIDLRGLTLSNGTSLNSWFAEDHNLESVNLSGLNTSDVKDWSSLFRNNYNLKTIIGLSDLNINSADDMNDMFMSDKDLTSIDLSNFDTTSVRANNHSGSGGNGLYKMISGCTNLRQIKLGPKSILTDQAINGNKHGSYSFSPQYGLIDIADGTAHPGTWTLLQGAQYGNWGTANWILDQNGDLVIHDGTLSWLFNGSNDRGGIDNVPGLPINKVKHIYTYNVTSPTGNAGNNPFWADSYNLFCMSPNLQSVDLSGMNFANCRSFGFMFYGDSNLKYINFGTLNDKKALLTHTSIDPNGIHDMFNGVQPTELVMGPNTILNTAIGNSFFGSYLNNHKNVVNLTDNQAHPGDWRLVYGNVGNWGTATWALDSNTGTLYLANGSMNTDDPRAHGIPLNQVKHIETYNVVAPNSMPLLFGTNYVPNQLLPNVQTIDLTGMDTSNVTSMGGLFDNDRNLQAVKLPVTSTSKVNDMSWMFAGDKSLAKLDVPNSFDTRNANLSFMFDSDSNLKSLSLPNSFQNNRNSSSVFGPGKGSWTSDLADLTLNSDTKLGNNANLPGSWVNISSDNPQSFNNIKLNNNQAHPGVWTRNAEMVEYSLNGNTNNIVGRELVMDPMGTTITSPRDPSNLSSDYRVTNPGQSFTVNGGIVNVPVEDATVKTVNSTVNVVYENNYGNTTTDNVPVTLTGRDNSTVYFPSADLAAPSGYRLDKGNTQSDYAFNIGANQGWQGGTPTIHFTGNQETNDNVLVHQIIESPNGVVLNASKTTSVPEHMNVGDQYTIYPGDVKQPQALASSNAKLTLDNNKSKKLNGEVMAGPSNTTFLSNPNDTLYYIESDASAKSSLTAHYINQANKMVGDSTASQYVGSSINAGSFGNVPNGYTVKNAGTSYKFGINGGDVKVPVTGVQEPVNVEYDYNNTQVPGSIDDQKSGQVGNTIQLPTDHLPAGYQLDPNDDTDYTVNYSDVQNGAITRKLNVEPSVKILPVQFVNQKGTQVGNVNYSVAGQVGKRVNLPEAPAGYQYASGTNPTPTYQQSDIDPNHVNRFKQVTVNVVGDHESLPVTFVDGNNQIEGKGTIRDQIGNSDSLQNKLQSQLPQGYQINNPDIDYVFTSNKMSQKSGQMVPINVYVNPTDQHYQLTVNAREIPNHKNGKPDTATATITTPFTVSGPDSETKTYTVDPNNYVPAGYTNDSNNHSLQVKITNQGLVTANSDKPISDVTWNYNVKYVNDAINFAYVDNSDGQKQPVSQWTPVSGNVNSHINLTEHYAMPAGYALDNDVQTNYLITSSDISKPQTVQLYVHSIYGNKTQSYQLNVVTEDQNGNRISSDQIPIPITVNANQYQTISSNSYYPNGDKTHYQLDSSKSTNGGNVSVQNIPEKVVGKTTYPAKLSSNGGTFYYKVDSAAPIDVKYLNQNNQTVGKVTISGTGHYYGQSVDVTKDNKGNTNLPAGYDLVNGQNPNQTFNSTKDNKNKDKSKSVTLYVLGRTINTLTPVQLLHTSSRYPNQNGQLPDGVQETVDIPIAGRVGDTLKINSSSFKGYLPTGYTFATPNNDTAVGHYNIKNSDDYSNHTYTVTLTSSDAEQHPTKSGQGQLISNSSWQHGNNDPYWANATDFGNSKGMPLLVLQAQDNKTINFHIFDTHNNLIDTITIGKDNIRSDSGVLKAILNSKDQSLVNTAKSLDKVDPSYDDSIDTSSTSPYMDLLPRGYYYDNNSNPANPQQVRFGMNSEDASIHVAGKPETIKISYVDASGKSMGPDTSGTTYRTSDGTVDPIRVGDTVNLPRLNVPEGYYVASDQPNQYTVKYSDDSASAKPNDKLTVSGTINRTLKVLPDNENLPVKLVNQNGDLVGSLNEKGTIGQSIKLSADVNRHMPSGYTLNSSDSNTYKSYQFSTDGMADAAHDNGFMKPVTLHVTGQSATVHIYFVDDNGKTVDSKDIPSQVGNTVNLPSTSSDAYNNYGLSTNYNVVNSPHSVLVQPNDVANGASANVNVDGNVHDATNLKVNVVYEHGSGQPTKTNDVPVTITGRYGSTTYFNPADLAMPAGYQLDTNQGKTQISYPVSMDDTDDQAQWLNSNNQVTTTEPTIYLTGNADNQDVQIKQVVESANGVITNIVPTNYHVNGKVGDTYKVSDSKVTAPSGTSLASGQEPNANLNTALTGTVLQNDINGHSTVYLSQPTDVLYYVDPNAKSTITVKYVDQNNNVVGTKQMPSDAYGAPLSMSSVSGTGDVPKGYTYNSSNPTSVTYGTANKVLNIGVTGQPASVNAEYYDGSNAVGSAGTQSGHVGDTITLPADHMPNGYHLAGDASKYTLRASDANSSNQKTEPVKVAPNQMTLPIDFVDGNTTVGKAMIQGGRDDTNDAINSDLLPTGYHFSSEHNYDFSSNTPAGANLMPSDKVSVTPYDGTQIDLHFQMPGYSYDVENDKVSGQFGKQVDAMNYLPVGYHLANPSQNTSLVYTFNGGKASDKANNPVIEIEPDQANVKSMPVTVIYQTPEGAQLSKKSVNVPIKADTQGNFDIKPSDKPGYTVKASDIKGNLIGQLNVTSNNKGTITYQANNEAMPVNFINQDGDSVGSANAKGYYGEEINAGQLTSHNVTLPAGYQLMNSNVNYKFTGDTQPNVVMLKGNQSTKDAAITIVEKDPYGKQLKSFTVHEPVSGQVGDNYELDADQFTPNGYQAVATDQQDPQKLAGQIQPDGSLNNSSATFTYQSTAATNAKDLKPIYLVYLAGGQDISSDVVMPSDYSDIYAGEDVDLGSIINSDLSKSKSLSGYAFTSGQEPTASFDSTYPTTLYVQVQRKKGNPLTFNANVVQKFYSPNGKLLDAEVHPVSETGNMGSDFKISPKSYLVNGYKTASDHSDTGQITANGLTPDTVTYNYVAQPSNVKDSVVQPIYVTFKDQNGDQVGNPQRIDGSMDEIVNVMNHTTLPSDYHMVAGQNPFLTFGTGTKPQDVTFNVATNQAKVGKVTVMYYDGNNNLVNQSTAEAKVGSSFDLKPYEINVPQDYQFKNLDPDTKLISHADDQDPMVQVPNGTSYVRVNVNKIVTNTIVYEDIDNDQDPNARPVASQSVTGVAGSRYDLAKYLSAVPQGYHTVKLGSASPILNGGKDVIWIRHDPKANSKITVNYVKYDVNGKRIGSDQKPVLGRYGDSFDLANYENHLPKGYVFRGAQANGSLDYFMGGNQTITINVQQPAHQSNYGMVKVQFVKASDPSQQVGPTLISTGHDGHVFDIGSFEHEAPEGYNYAGIMGTIPNEYDSNNVQKLVIKVN